jgi:16S rRNA G966 N2-methylase RsmD
VALIQRNVAHVGVGRRADVRLADAFLWSRHFVPGERPTVVFLGPPYELCEGEELERLLSLVETVQSKLREEDVLVFQFAERMPTDRLPNLDDWYRLRKYGKTRIGLWRRADASKSDPDDQATP